MQETNKVEMEPIQGFFVILDEEERKLMAQQMRLHEARGGIFYKREELLSTLQTNEVLKSKEMHIISITVPQNAITNPNCKKFGIKRGEEIVITKIESFKDAVKEFNTI